MEHLKEALKDSTYYLGASVLAMICGLISLPIWTRTLSLEQYGVFSLVVITINFLSSGSKFGLQHAALRYYSHFIERGDEDGLTSYYTTIMGSGIIIGVVLCSFFVLIFDKLGGNFSNMNLPFIAFMIATLGIINSLNSIQMTILRAVQNAKLISILSVIKRYSNFLLPFLFVFLWGFSLLFTGWLITDLIILIYLFIILGKTFKFRLRWFSFNFLKEALGYSIPLIGFELSITMLAIGDRYMIKWLMGDASVGIYSAGYNIASYGSEIISSPMRMACVPIFLSIWERSGKEETREFLERLFKYYFLIAIPILFGMIYLRDDITLVLVSKKFIAASQIIPYVVSPLIIYGAFFIYGAGFFIKRRSLSLAGLTFLSALINIGLNFFLIPSYGLKGAAIATFVAYLILSYLIFIFSRKLIKVRIPTAAIAKYIFISFIMIYILSFISINGLVALAGKIVLGVITYCIGVLIVDADLRNISSSAYYWLRRRWFVTESR